MERRRPRLAHPQSPADLSTLGLKVPPLVAVELSRDPETGKHLLHQPLCGGGGALVRHRIRLRPFCEVVHGHEDVAVTGNGPRTSTPTLLHRRMVKTPYQLPQRGKMQRGLLRAMPEVTMRKKVHQPPQHSLPHSL
ncbi:unnamed protein product [Gadus morhua 'NCC']